MRNEAGVSLAGDIGGTFTDVVMDGLKGRSTRKVLTTVDTPEQGLLEGLETLLGASGVAFSDVGLFVHGTTLATNAILERKGARTALLTTHGFRDVLEIGTEGRFDQYDLNLVKPAPLVPRDMRLTVGERIDACGQVRVPLDITGLKAVAEKLRSACIESLAISFLHAYVNPEHERLAAEILASEVPGLSISISSEVCPEIGEYERTSTVVANAYVRPLIDGYLARMEARLKQAGFGGALKLISSSGGVTTIDTARRFPIRLVESGPAGGAIFAAHRARALGCDKVIAFDMGGTTAKVCLIRNGEPITGNRFEVDRTNRFTKGSGLPLRIPSVELVEIGAGGGSIASVDTLQRVTVGPESAGSHPGPACYPDGGKSATVTDANLVIGSIDPGRFAGGRIQLDRPRAADALDRAVGDKLNLSTEAAASSVIETVCESMASAIRVHAAELGEALDDYTMIAFGGAAPLHACLVADKVGIGKVIIPANAGVGSAIGFLEAPHAFELVKSRRMLLEAVKPDAVDGIFREIAREARDLASGDEGGLELDERRAVFMRYVGQGHEIKVPVPNEPGACTSDALRKSFESIYEGLFSRYIPYGEIELLSWSVLVSAAPRNVEALGPTPCGGPAEILGKRMIYCGAPAQWQEAPIYRRASLTAGSRIEGPAIIVEDETSTVVSASFAAVVDAGSNIVLHHKTIEGVTQ